MRAVIAFSFMLFSLAAHSQDLQAGLTASKEALLDSEEIKRSIAEIALLKRHQVEALAQTVADCRTRALITDEAAARPCERAMRYLEMALGNDGAVIENLLRACRVWWTQARVGIAVGRKYDDESKKIIAQTYEILDTWSIFLNRRFRDFL